MNFELERAAVISSLAERANGMGRTALMKFCYLLQVVCGVPLGYNFSLYSYGPFDSDVLSDLDAAEAMGGIKSTVVYYPSGYGYRIERGERAESVQQIGADFIRQYDKQLRWVVDEFGSWDASGLEVASTLIYSDQEAFRKSEKLTIPELAERVREIKPRYGQSQIEAYARQLQEKGLLRAAK